MRLDEEIQQKTRRKEEKSEKSLEGGPLETIPWDEEEEKRCPSEKHLNAEKNNFSQKEVCPKPAGTAGSGGPGRWS